MEGEGRRGGGGEGAAGRVEGRRGSVGGNKQQIGQSKEQKNTWEKMLSPLSAQKAKHYHVFTFQISHKTAPKKKI